MSRTRFIFTSLMLDALLVNVGIVGAFYLRFWGTPPAFNFDPYLTLAPVITVLFLIAGYIYGLYEPERTESEWEVARAVFQAVALGTLLSLALLYAAGPRFISFPRLVIALAVPFVSATLIGWRIAALRLTPVRWPKQRVLLVGVNPLAFELADELVERSRWGYEVVGMIEREEEACVPPKLHPPVLGKISDLARIVAEQSVDRVIVTSPVEIREVMEDITLSDETGVRVDVVPELYEIFMGRVDSIVSDIPLMELTRGRSPAWYGAAKRLVDVVLALLLIVVLSPVLLLAALGILLGSGRPVLYLQDRVGKDMRAFRVAKFRTMVRNAEQRSGPVFATEDDQRITRLGRFLRRYRIDEFPQLFNILAGDMSFVGPRPERPFFVETFLKEIPGYRERFKAKPGVTGMAQVSGSYATTPERKLKYDLIYMYHQNLLMDLQILVETVRVVLTGRGAR